MFARPAGESCRPLIREEVLPNSRPLETPRNVELNPNFRASNWVEFNSFNSGRSLMKFGALNGDEDGFIALGRGLKWPMFIVLSCNF